jgi:hypothetical protein
VVQQPEPLLRVLRHHGPRRPLGHLVWLLLLGLQVRLGPPRAVAPLLGLRVRLGLLLAGAPLPLSGALLLLNLRHPPPSMYNTIQCNALLMVTTPSVTRGKNGPNMTRLYRTLHTHTHTSHTTEVIYTHTNKTYLHINTQTPGASDVARGRRGLVRFAVAGRTMIIAGLLRRLATAAKAGFGDARLLFLDLLLLVPLPTLSREEAPRVVASWIVHKRVNSCVCDDRFACVCVCVCVCVCHDACGGTYRRP